VSGECGYAGVSGECGSVGGSAGTQVCGFGGVGICLFLFKCYICEKEVLL